MIKLIKSKKFNRDFYLVGSDSEYNKIVNSKDWKEDKDRPPVFTAEECKILKDMNVSDEVLENIFDIKSIFYNIRIQDVFKNGKKCSCH